jgi:hypothetical protein
MWAPAAFSQTMTTGAKVTARFTDTGSRSFAAGCIFAAPTVLSAAVPFSQTLTSGDTARLVKYARGAVVPSALAMLAIATLN